MRLKILKKKSMMVMVQNMKIAIDFCMMKMIIVTMMATMKAMIIRGRE